MSHPERRSSSSMSRSQRQKRAYQLTLATGGGALATVVVLVLAVAGVTSFGLAFLLALVTAGFGFLLKRTVGT